MSWKKKKCVTTDNVIQQRMKHGKGRVKLVMKYKSGQIRIKWTEILLQLHHNPTFCSVSFPIYEFARTEKRTNSWNVLRRISREGKREKEVERF